MTIGRGVANDITLADPEASAIHAALEPLRRGMERPRPELPQRHLRERRARVTERPLRRGDEIRMVAPASVYRPESSPVATDPTATPHGVPDLTRREREVLLALFSGRDTGRSLLEPATTHQIATELHVTDAAVKPTPRQALRQVCPHAFDRALACPAANGLSDEASSASQTFAPPPPEAETPAVRRASQAVAIRTSSPHRAGRRSGCSGPTLRHLSDSHPCLKRGDGRRECPRGPHLPHFAANGRPGPRPCREETVLAPRGGAATSGRRRRLPGALASGGRLHSVAAILTRSPRYGRDHLGDRWRCGGRGKAEPRRRQHRAQLSEVRAVEGSRQAGDRMVVGRPVPTPDDPRRRYRGCVRRAWRPEPRGRSRCTTLGSPQRDLAPDAGAVPGSSCDRTSHREGAMPSGRPAAIGSLINADVFDTQTVEGVGRPQRTPQPAGWGQQDAVSICSFDHRVRESRQRRGPPTAHDDPDTAAAADPNDLATEPTAIHPNSICQR